MKLLVTFVAAFVISCSSSSARERCSQCGMFVDLAPAWTAEVITHDGKKAFDSPRCLIQWKSRARGAQVRESRVKDYYDQRFIPAARAFFVIGSDVRSPMGEDFVPFASEEDARTFIRDHGGQALRFEQLSPQLFQGKKQ